jgi:hypothetical protein
MNRPLLRSLWSLLDFVSTKSSLLRSFWFLCQIFSVIAAIGDKLKYFELSADCYCLLPSVSCAVLFRKWRDHCYAACDLCWISFLQRARSYGVFGFFAKYFLSLLLLVIRWMVKYFELCADCSCLLPSAYSRLYKADRIVTFFLLWQKKSSTLFTL